MSISSTMFTHVGFVAGIIAAVFGAALVFATPAYAQTQGACVQPDISGFIPYVYDGELHSFDYFVPNVQREQLFPLQTVIFGINTEAHYSTKWISGVGTKIHVDVPNWQDLSGQIPIVVHVKASGGTCETTATFYVSLPQTLIPVSTEGAAVLPAQNVTSGRGEQHLPVGPNVTVDITSPSETKETSGPLSIKDILSFGTSDKSSASDQDKTATSSQLSALLAFFKKVGSGAAIESVSTVAGECTSLPILFWVLFALIHAAIAGAIIFFLRDLISENNLWFAVSLLVPFVGFLAAWFVFDGCRMYQWFPVVVALISLGAVLAVPAKGEGETKTGGPVMKMPPKQQKEAPTS